MGYRSRQYARGVQRILERGVWRYAWIATILCCTSAFAGEAQLSWTPPTQNVDGTPLDDLAGYKIYYTNTASGGPYDASEDVPNPAISFYTVSGLGDGTWYFVVTAYDDGLNEDGSVGQVNESVYSNEAVKFIINAPAPPSMLTVADETVYVYIFQLNRIVLTPVGTVPAGTPCDPQESINGYYRVDVEAVEFAQGGARPKVAVAQCE